MNLNAIMIMAALAQQVPPELLLGVCWVESHHNPNAVAPLDGNEDSLGLCQIKLSTANDLGFRGGRAQLMRPEENARWAARYLRFQLNRYHGNIDRALTAYNQGHALAVTKYARKVRYYARRYRAVRIVLPAMRETSTTHQV